MCTIIVASLFSFPNGSDSPYWSFLTVKSTRAQWTVLWVSTNVCSAYHHHHSQHQGCFLLPASSLLCPWHATLPHPGSHSHWSPLPRGTEVPFSEVTERVMPSAHVCVWCTWAWPASFLLLSIIPSSAGTRILTPPILLMDAGALKGWLFPFY